MLQTHLAFFPGSPIKQVTELLVFNVTKSLLYKRSFIDRACLVKTAGSYLCLFYGMAISVEQASTKYSFGAGVIL